MNDKNTSYQYPTLKGRKNFQRIFKKGIFIRGSAVSLKFYKDPNIEDSSSQWSYCVSHKIGKACLRNRKKRILRESLRLSKVLVKSGYHIALFPQEHFEKLKLSDRQKNLKSLLYKAHILKEGTNKC